TGPDVASPRVARPDELVRRSLEGAALGAPQHRLLDLSRELEVLVGNPARRVILELHDHPSPGHGEVGVMVRGFRDVADRVYEHQCGGPAVGLIGAADPTVLVPPAGEVLQLRFDVRVGVGGLFRCHAVSLWGNYTTLPPLISNIWPVTYPAASEARY